MKYKTLYSLFIFLLIIGCKKENFYWNLRKNPDNTPIISTTVVSNITTTSALSGGTVSYEGGGPITQRGIVWSKTQNPTLSNNHTSNGIGIGGFSSSITGLDPSTKYYVKAYATNSFGTYYGNQFLLKTPK